MFKLIVQRDYRLFCYQQAHTAGASSADGQTNRTRREFD